MTMNTDEPVNILIVDDKAENLLALKSVLESDPSIKILTAQNGNDALALMLEHDFALVLMDVQMPEMDGFETARLMRGRNKTRNIPIIFVTAINTDENHVFMGYESGAVDYLFKPINPDILRSKINVLLKMYKQNRSLVKTTENLRQTLEEFKKANQKIIEQQRSVIEEERLKILLQMAGATAHELNQPLMSLLGHIDLMEMYKDNPEKLDRQMEKVRETGLRISDTVKKIQNIRRYKTKTYLKNQTIINLNQRIRIICVEHPNRKSNTVEELLADYNQFDVGRVDGISNALELLKKAKPFDLIIVDHSLPDGNGFDFLNIMRKNGHKDIPCILIMDREDEMLALKLLQAGFDNYLSESKLNDKSISQAIANTLEKTQIRKEIDQTMRQMAELSIKDGLTGLYNRRYFKEMIEREISRALRYETDLVICMIDIDDFKKININFGYLAGDLVLTEIGTVLSKFFRKSDLLCRYDGEEFAVIFPNTGLQEAKIVCERFRKTVECYSFEMNSIQIPVTVSIGIASLGQLEHHQNKTGGNLIRLAGQAVMQSRENGQNMCRRYQK